MIVCGLYFGLRARVRPHVLCTGIDVLEVRHLHQVRCCLHVAQGDWYLRLKHLEQKLQVNGLCATSAVHVRMGKYEGGVLPRTLLLMAEHVSLAHKRLGT